MDDLKIPNHYIAINKEGKEQIVYYDSKYINTNTNQILYNGYYGVYGYHEVYTNIENIRKLTKKEQAYLNKNEFWNLPQHFYQSVPEF